MYVSDTGKKIANFWGEISIILLYFTQLFIIFIPNKKWENYSQMHSRHNLWNCHILCEEKLSNKASKTTKCVYSFSMKMRKVFQSRSDSRVSIVRPSVRPFVRSSVHLFVCNAISIHAARVIKRQNKGQIQASKSSVKIKRQNQASK